MRCIVAGSDNQVHELCGLLSVAPMVREAANGLQDFFCLFGRMDTQLEVCLIEDESQRGMMWKCPSATLTSFVVEGIGLSVQV